jgi:cytochrome bd-type quinol oxidase subunit 2
MSIFKKLTVIFALFGFLVLLPSSAVSAQSSLACEGLTGIEDCTVPSETEPSVKSTLETMLDLLSMVAGIIAVIMIIVAGTKFITSQGDSGKVASARSSIIYALVGLIIVILAQTIIYFVIDNTINVDVPPPTQNCPAGQTCAS